MVERKIALLFLFAGLMTASQLLLGQSPGTVQQAQQKAEEGDFPAAISLYQRALNAETSAAAKQGIQDALDEVTRQYYADLHRQAQQAPTLEEKVRLLSQAQGLNLRGWLFTDFEKVVLSVREMTEQVFNELKAEAEAAAARQAHPAAVSNYELAHTLDSLAFDRENLAAGLATSQEQIRVGRDLAQQARTFLDQGRYQEAREKFQQANSVTPGLPQVEEGLKRAESMALLQEGRRQAEAGYHARAEANYQQALTRDPENREAARLLEASRNYREHVRQGKISYTRGNCERSVTEFRQAQQLDGQRFRQDRLQTLLQEGCAGKLPLPVSEIRDAMLMLFEGRTGDSIQMLESLLQESGDSHPQIPAFLGAAYCYSAWLSPQPDLQLLENARSQFRSALASDPGYRLSEKLFSPRILKLFEEVRSEMGGSTGDTGSDSN